MHFSFSDKPVEVLSWECVADNVKGANCAVGRSCVLAAGVRGRRVRLPRLRPYAGRRLPQDIRDAGFHAGAVGRL